MVRQRLDVQRVFQHLGLDSTACQQFSRQAIAGAAPLIAAGAPPAANSPNARRVDPAARAAALRARLLASLSGRTKS